MDISTINVLLAAALPLAGTGLAAFLRMDYRRRRAERDRLERDMELLKGGVQALLRDRLVALYKTYYMEQHYVPLHIKESYENCYQHYHSLGANGIMDGMARDVRKAPIAPPSDETEQKGGCST